MEVMIDVRTPEDEGVIVESPNFDFTIGVVCGPDPESCVMVYGVINNKTRVIEAFTNSLAKARYIAEEFHKDLVEGVDREVVSPFAQFLKPPSETPPTSGKVN